MALPLIKETANIRARERGFVWHSLKDRYHICKRTNMGHLLSSDIGGKMR
jgi:hypothetical protein